MEYQIVQYDLACFQVQGRSKDSQYSVWEEIMTYETMQGAVRFLNELGVGVVVATGE